MKTRLLLAAMVAGFFLAGSTAAQRLSFIPLSVDYAVFENSGDEEYVEIYVAFLQNTLRFTTAEEGYEAIFAANLQIYQGDSLIDQQTDNFRNICKTEEETREPDLLRHIFTRMMKPGKYSARVMLTDLNSGSKGEFLTDLEVKAMAHSGPQLSDIQLSVQISKAQGESKFEKNGLRVIPNPSAAYNVTVPVLYYYAEAYNLAYSADGGGSYLLESFVTDVEGQPVRQFASKRSRKPGPTSVIVGGNNVVALPAGTYLFHLRLTDDETGKTAEAAKRFTLIKPSKEQLERTAAMASTNSEWMLHEYSGFSEEQLDEEFAQAKYIASSEEKDAFSSLDRTGKIRFLMEFWSRRDSDPSTPQNEFREKYMQMVQYAQANFTTKFRDGWKSDRGRVLMVYGPPNEIERSPSQRASKPYEIWSYNELEGGSIFVFADLRGFGEYELLHSTYSRELSQPDWQRLVQRPRSSDDLESFDFR